MATMNRHLGSAPELVVVDNLSRDDPERAAREYRGQVRFVPLERNVGFGAACNIGVENASGSCVVMLNPDTELVDASLDELAAFALRRRALAGPRLLNPDGSVQPSASGAPVGPWPWVGAILPGRLQPGPLRDRTEPWRATHTVRVAWLTGACVAGATRGPARARAVRPGHPPVLRGHGPRPARGAGRASPPGSARTFAGLSTTGAPRPRSRSRRGVGPAGGRQPPRGRAARLRRPARAGELARATSRTCACGSRPRRVLGRDASGARDALEATRNADPIPNLPAS